MNIWLLAVIVILLSSYILELTVSLLNLKALVPTLPETFRSVYDQGEYKKSQDYTRATGYLSILAKSWTTILTLIFLLLGGFNYIDIWARDFGFSEIISGLLFTGGLLLLSFVAELPLSIYRTFVVEERFGFNRTTIRTYLLDIVKGSLLTVVIGGPLLALIFWFFMYSGAYGWIYCWLGVVAFSVVMQFLAPVLIMPLFNTFTPLEDGPLKEAILGYAAIQRFTIQGIFTMDGSKRSSKLNAFFTGFGRFKKIVFFDTLIEKLSVEEIVAVLAHEMGHFKLKHIVKMMLGSIVQSGIMFYLLSLFLTVPEISLAFGLTHPSVYSSLVIFGFVYTPVNLLVSLLFHAISRKHEFQADTFAATTTEGPEMLISSLKKLSQANLSNLTPHPLYVFLHYSHPPLLQRIANLENRRQQGG